VRGESQAADARAQPRQAEKLPRQSELFAALVEACYGRPVSEVSLTRAERGRIAAAAKQLLAIGATPDEVIARAKQYRARWPNVDLTPTALAANWALLTTPLPASRAKKSSLDIAIETLTRIRAHEQEVAGDSA
jgi:hypothetical protein